MTEETNPSTLRMRRRRERIKSGAVSISFVMAPAAVDRLIELGWLKPGERHNSTAVAEALLNFGAKALWPDQWCDA